MAGAFNFAKGGYFIKNGLLFHRAKIFDNTVERLVVPKGRRRSLLELAHGKLGCHLARKKTKERIGLSFMWPTMNKDVVDYCQTCEVCQKRAPITYLDRVPIEGGVVSTEPVFSHFYVYALGQLFNQKVEYNYCIVFLDHASCQGRPCDGRRHCVYVAMFYTHFQSAVNHVDQTASVQN